MCQVLHQRSAPIIDCSGSKGHVLLQDREVRWGFRNLLVVNDKKNDFVLDILHTNQLLCSQDRNTLKDICVILCFINISMLENGC